ncbi:MAG: hypothetical protein ABFS23_06830 [Pseudomonadota bacterium]
MSQSHAKIFTGLLLFFVLALTFTSAMAKQGEAICHWQPGKGSWKLVAVSEKSAGNHMANHDDALPGGTSAVTNVRLDENCARQTGPAPCGNCLEVDSDRLGCENAACENIVCNGNIFEVDPICCNTGWIQGCELVAQAHCECAESQGALE